MTPFYVSKNTGWFKGGYTHIVIIRNSGNTLCASNRHSCILIAQTMSAGISGKQHPTEEQVLEQ